MRLLVVAILLGVTTLDAQRLGRAAGVPGEVVPDPLTITTSSLAECQVGNAYSQILTATGGVPSYSWSVSAGALPSGLSLNANTGVISGTCTVVETQAFTVRVTDLALSLAHAALSITTTDATPDLPLRRSGHPRLLVIPAGGSGTGVPLDTLRTRLQTADYSTSFADYIETVDAAATDPTGKSKAATCYDGYAFAFLALLDPVSNGFAGAQSQATYAAAAKAHALAIAAQMTAGTWKDNNDSEHLTDNNSVNMSIALIYDWTRAAGTSWSDADKIALLDGSLQNFYNAGTIGGSYVFSSQFLGYFLPVLSVVLHDEVPAGSTTISGVSRTYAQEVETLYDYWYQKWLYSGSDSRSKGIEDNYTVIMGDSQGVQMPNSREGASYLYAYAQHTMLNALLFSTATNFDLMTRNNYLSKWGELSLHLLRPAAHVQSFKNIIRFGTRAPADGFDSGQGRYGMVFGAASAAAYQASPDTTLVRMMRWWRVEHGLDWSPGADNATVRKAYQTLFRYALGTDHLGAALSPLDGALATSREFGNGWFSFKTGFADEEESHVTLHAPEVAKVGGHWGESDFSAFTIEKFGDLIILGGNNKGAAPSSIGWQSSSQLDATQMGVFMTGEGTNGTAKRNGLYAGHWFNETQPGGTGLCATTHVHSPINGTDQTVSNSDTYCGATVERRHLAAAADALTGYDYVRYEYSIFWNPLKVSYADRELVYQRGATDHEYVITVDRLTALDATYRKFWNARLPDNVTSTAAWTTVEEGADFHRRQGGIWTTPGTATLKMANTFLVRGHQSHGVVYLQSLTPAGTWTKIGGDYYEQRDATAAYAAIAAPDPTQLTITSIVASGSVALVTTSANHKLGNNSADYVLIEDTSGTTPSVDGQHLATKVSNTTFTIPVSITGSASSGTVLRSYISDEGANYVGAYRLELTPTAASLSDVFVTVLQFGDNNSLAAMSPTTLITGGDLIGAQIDDSTQQQMHLFSDETAGELPPCLTAGCVVSPTLTGSIRVRVYNLTPAATYYYTAPAADDIELRNATFTGATSVVASAAGVIEWTYTR